MSFNFNTIIRRGSWLEYRRFLLNQRRNIPSRVRVINAELTRIGDVQVLYRRADAENDKSPMTERVMGIFTKQGSSIGKLLQAYIASGGNPFAISMFLKPDSYDIEYNENDNTVELIDNQPYKGVIYPVSQNPDEGDIGMVYQAGWLSFWRYPGRKLNSNSSPVQETTELGKAIVHTRDWARQEIKELRNDLEYRILSLCDLREQLIRERDVLLMKAGGDVIPGMYFDDEYYSRDHHLNSIINKIDSVFWEIGADGFADFTKPRKVSTEMPFPTLVEDAYTGEEKWKALG